MKVQRKLLVLALFFAAQLAVPAQAEDETDSDELDVTLTVVEADEDVEDAVNTIQLPEQASEVAKESTAFGLATANTARQRAKDESGEVKNEAKEAAEQAKAAAKSARESAKNGNEAAEEAVKNGLSGGGTENIPEDVLDNIPDDVKDKLPIDLDSVIDGADEKGRGNLPGS
ncbi:hypothetical protein [Microbulbifer rhizosphaerae]|uniref:Chemotaxis response regulator CheB n=1 Tax=Microbulbifer rhizosphaerae TaxID=1562603 RepID=A0A7W4WG39_9GAMM|nr:hypothetical protein [Microbulbifer rhizosphaerae]MBB3063543.1 chemotaxis response regulator CheB [Microbulbifer rhizosphaerae]